MVTMVQSTRNTRRPAAPSLPRDPTRVGRILAQTGSLKGLPYGPGPRQETALEAYRRATQQPARRAA